MEQVSMIILQIIPALLVFLVAYYFLKRSFDRSQKMSEIEIVKEKIRVTTPLRLQAYERLILMLERVVPGSLVMRHQKSGQTVGQLQLTMLKSVREEFDHNVSMQMYISQQAWELVLLSKEETMQIIKASGSHLKADDASMEMSRVMLDLESKSGKQINTSAIRLLKQEVRELFS